MRVPDTSQPLLVQPSVLAAKARWSDESRSDKGAGSALHATVPHGITGVTKNEAVKRVMLVMQMKSLGVQGAKES